MSLAYKISAFSRGRKFKMFLGLQQPAPEATLLGVGSNGEECSESDNLLEGHYRYPDHITALWIDTPKKFLKRYPRVNSVQYDGKMFPFKDRAIDVCCSYSVLKHVGDRGRQALFS